MSTATNQLDSSEFYVLKCADQSSAAFGDYLVNTTEFVSNAAAARRFETVTALLRWVVNYGLRAEVCVQKVRLSPITTWAVRAVDDV